MTTPSWSLSELDAAADRGSHASADEYHEFVREEMADMVDKGFWTVLPYHEARRLPGLRLSPLGVVPQRERRPRIIVDYSYSRINTETAKRAPPEAMQFGRTLERLFERIYTANPRFGPVHMLKLDIADGFYQMWLATKDIPSLGVIMPTAPGEPRLAALPLVLPMGWTESPPYFCTMTETATDLANTALQTRWDPPRHPLEAMAAGRTEEEPTRSAHRASQVTQDLHHHLRLHQCHHNTQRIHPQRPANQPLAYVDVFVDDHVALAQGSSARLCRVRRVVLHTIDSVLRPNDEHDSHRREPISTKKLKKMDGAWDTKKVVLGWLLDTVAGTITLPEHRQERLHRIIEQVRGRKRVSTRTWHKFLGELRSMVLAIPGARGLFSQLQVAFRHSDRHRIRLHQAAWDALDDLHVLATDMSARPTSLSEVVARKPQHIGSTDAAKAGMGGVWLPAPGQTYPPTVWRTPFPQSIQDSVVSTGNPTGTVTNSDLELAGVIAGQSVLTNTTDVTDSSLGLLTDNTAAQSWHNKGSTTTEGPAAYLLRFAALHQRQHRYQSHVRYIPGPANAMADDASRRFDLTDDALLAHFTQTYPQREPWQLRSPSSDVLLKLISALRQQKPPHPSQTAGHAISRLSGTGPGSHMLPPWGTATPFYPKSMTKSRSSLSLPAESVTDASASATSRSDLLRWLTPSMRWQRRSPAWGPETHGTAHTMLKSTPVSATCCEPTGTTMPLRNGSVRFPSRSCSTLSTLQHQLALTITKPSRTYPSSLSSSCCDPRSIPTQEPTQSQIVSQRAPSSSLGTNSALNTQATQRPFTQQPMSRLTSSHRRIANEGKPSLTDSAATLMPVRSVQQRVASITSASTKHRQRQHFVQSGCLTSGSRSHRRP